MTLVMGSNFIIIVGNITLHDFYARGVCAVKDLNQTGNSNKAQLPVYFLRPVYYVHLSNSCLTFSMFVQAEGKKS